MSVEESCNVCTQNEKVWVTTMEDQELCVDNLVEWGKYFSKFVTKTDECQESTVRSLSDIEIGRIIAAVVVAVVFVGWVAYALYLRYRRRSRDRFLLFPYVELRRGVSEDRISLATNFSFLSCSEADSSSSEYPQSSTQSGSETDAEPKPKPKIITEPESESVPKSEPEPDAETEPETKTEPGSEPEPIAEIEPETKTEPESEPEPDAETENKTGTDAASERDEEHYFPAHENNSSSDSDSSFSLHGETTLEDEDSDANAPTYSIKKETYSNYD